MCNKGKLCEIQFDNKAESMTVDRLCGKEPQFIVLESERSIRMLHLLTFLRPEITDPDPECDNSEPARRLNKEGAEQFSMPLWFSQHLAVWLSNALRLHTLYNSFFPPGIERPLCIDTCVLTKTEGLTTISIVLHASTCTCWCGKQSKGQPTVRVMFGTDLEDSISIKAVCKHKTSWSDNSFVLDIARNSPFIQRDVFLTCVCTTALALTKETSDADVKTLRSALQTSYMESIQISRTLASPETLLMHDKMAETMLRMRVFKHKKRRVGRSYEDLGVHRTDNVPLKSFEKEALTTHSHLFG